MHNNYKNESLSNKEIIEGLERIDRESSIIFWNRQENWTFVTDDSGVEYLMTHIPMEGEHFEIYIEISYDQFIITEHAPNGDDEFQIELSPEMLINALKERYPELEKLPSFPDLDRLALDNGVDYQD